MVSCDFLNISDTVFSFTEEQNKFLHKLSELLMTNEVSIDTMTLCNDSVGFPQNYYKILFPGGTRKILESLEAFFDQLLIDKINEDNSLDNIHGLINKTSYMITTRIQISKNALKTLNRLLLPPPLYSSLILKNRYRTCDIIWHLNNDISLDHNYYTKRMILFNVYNLAITKYVSGKTTDDTMYEDVRKDISCILNSVRSVKNTINNLTKLPIIRLFR